LPILILLLTSCTKTFDVGNVAKIAIPREQLNATEVDKIELERLEWFIITEANAQSKFNEISNKNFTPVFFGLTDKGYETLSINTKKTMSLAEQQRSLIKAYKNYYEANEGNLDNLEEAKKNLEKSIIDFNGQ